MWGLDDAASKFRRESEDELEHAQRLTRHLLSLGLLPKGSHLDGVRAGRSLKEMLLADWHLEAEAIRLYTDASQYCARIRDEAAYQLFLGLLQEEQHHLEDLELWLADLK